MGKHRLNVAVIFGGCSSEYSVSLESTYSMLGFIDREKYNPIMVGISKSGDWFHFRGNIDKIRDDKWCNEEDCVPAVLSADRYAKKLILLNKDYWEYINIDAAFPVLHGKNGEDGTVQGLIELAGIPLAGCGVLASALCMDKDRAHRLVKEAGIRVPRAIVINKPSDENKEQHIESGREQEDRLVKFAGEIGYPIFVKPVKAGSSYGITKAADEAELRQAVKLAFEYDDQVIAEENIDGFEVGCAVLGNEELTVGVPDEIELSGGFFDFTEKYMLKTSSIHVPARVSEEKLHEIQENAKVIYKILGCSGFARVDMFLTPSGEIVFNEVNTIPGFTEHSRYPNMMKEAGISFTEVISRAIELAVE